ncbi:hypothetical protein Bbelb_001840 [Branchiostoma belcheri]|nr:hypothetical protein Bbelb_001840 [Branchiostoma belcheri]
MYGRGNTQETEILLQGVGQRVKPGSLAGSPGFVAMTTANPGCCRPVQPGPAGGLKQVDRAGSQRFKAAQSHKSEIVGGQLGGVYIVVGTVKRSRKVGTASDWVSLDNHKQRWGHLQSAQSRLCGLTSPRAIYHPNSVTLACPDDEISKPEALLQDISMLWARHRVQPRGRPKLCKATLQVKDFSIESWEKVASDRSNWRAAIHKGTELSKAARETRKADTRSGRQRLSLAEEKSTTQEYCCRFCGSLCRARISCTSDERPCSTRPAASD